MARKLNVQFPTSSPYTLQASTGKIWVASANNSFIAPLNTGFTPDAGWSTATTNPNVEQPFVIMRPAADLGTGAILVLYDDFSNAVAGPFPYGRTPTAGTAIWSNPASGGTPVFARQNASSTGPAMSPLNNERPGAASGFARTAMINFGANVNAAYLSYHENWRFSWPLVAGNSSAGRNNEGGGGGYYKQNWFMKQASPAFGQVSFDCVGPDFLEQSSDLTPTNITWNAGVCTVTVPNYGATRFPGVTNWQTWFTDSAAHTNPNFVVSNVLATYISDTQFSYPLAANPGTYTFNAGCSIVPPGGGAANQSGVPSGQILTAFAANNSHFGGNKQIAGDSNGISLWDPGASVANTGWNTVCTAIIGDPANPTTSPTTLFHQLYNAVHQQAINYSTTTPAIFNSASGYDSMNQVQVPGLMQDMGVHTVDRSNYYLTVGPDCLNGFCIADGATIGASTFISDCTYNSWSANAATIVLRQGRAPHSVSGLYLYWRNSAGLFTRVGRFT